MHIRLTQERDLPEIDHIFKLGCEYQHQEGNYSQWHEGYPSLDVVRDDIKNGYGFVCVLDESDCHEGSKLQAGAVVGTYALTPHEVAYDVIKEGAWSLEAPYQVLHRMGTIMGLGAGKFILEHLKHHYDYIRVDTHESNKTMRRVLTKAGFAYCGVVFYEGYGDMLAYDFVHAAVRPL